MVVSREWAKVSESCTRADESTGAATVVSAHDLHHSYFFFSEAAALLLLVQPISDAIHQLEADKPLLSQMVPIWNQLLKRAEIFDTSNNNSREAILPLFRRRYEIHQDKAWPSAFVLDPIHARLLGGEWLLPFAGLKPAELKAARACFIELGGAANEEAIETEIVKLPLAPLPGAMCDALWC